jgi:hypothetical protein
MKTLRSSAVAALLALAIAPAASRAAEKANPGWEKMKSLVGDWDGTYEGKPGGHVSYKLVSNGTALMEVISSANEPEMVTMYTPDGSRLLMTHYCSEGNQPRMRAEAPAADAKQISFSFLDVSNLSGPEAGHMQHLDVLFKDPDHFAQRWTYHAAGKDQTSTFEYARKH